MQDIYLTPIQAAEFLGVSKYTLQNQRVQRVGPPFIKIRNRLVALQVSGFDRLSREKSRCDGRLK